MDRAIFSRQCLDLPRECSVCSARFSPVPHPHNAGNMWVARCSYIVKLIPPFEFMVSPEPVSAAACTIVLRGLALLFILQPARRKTKLNPISRVFTTCHSFRFRWTASWWTRKPHFKFLIEWQGSYRIVATTGRRISLRHGLVQTYLRHSQGKSTKKYGKHIYTMGNVHPHFYCLCPLRLAAELCAMRRTKRYAMEHWVHSHPHVQPCDVYNNVNFTWGYDNLPRVQLKPPKPVSRGQIQKTRLRRLYTGYCADQK